MVRLDEEPSDNDKSINTNRNDSVSSDGPLETSQHDPYYPPIVNLPEVEVPTGEDDEKEIFKLRAKLFRFDSEPTPPEWKERGTGDVRLLQHTDSKLIRLLMRREKTLRICANHFVRPWMILKPMSGSDRAYIWQVHADFADEETKTEVLAIRFANAENAAKFKSAFDDAVIIVTEVEATSIELAETLVRTEDNEGATETETPSEISEDVAEVLKQLTVKEN